MGESTIRNLEEFKLQEHSFALILLYLFASIAIRGFCSWFDLHQSGKRPNINDSKNVPTIS